MQALYETQEITGPGNRLVIWHTEGTAISGLLSWMWRLKKSLPNAGISLTLVSLELRPFRFRQICDPSVVYDVRIRTPQELVAFLKNHRSSVHIVNHAYDYIDLLKKLHPGLLRRLNLVGICHTDQNYYYYHLQRLDSQFAGMIAVSPKCQETIERTLPHRRGTIPVLPDWDMPMTSIEPVRSHDSKKPLRILFNGRLLDLQKRVLDLPRITRQLAQMGVPAELTIVGDGPDLPNLRESLTRGTHIPCHILPPRPPWQMDELMENHDVFLQVSEFEGASVSLMEAMAAGLVPVVTRTESGIELLKHGRNALLSSVGDIAGITGQLRDLADDRTLLSKLSGEAFHTARAALGELDYARRMRQFMDTIAHGAHSIAA